MASFQKPKYQIPALQGRDRRPWKARWRSLWPGLTRYQVRIWPDVQLGRYLPLIVSAGLVVLLYAVGQWPSHEVTLPVFLVILSALAAAAPIPLKGTSEAAERNERLASMNQMLDRRGQELQTLHQINLGLNHSQSLTSILDLILHRIADLIHADAAAIFLCERDREAFRMGGHVGFSPEYIAEAQPALNCSAVRALREGRPLVICGQSLATPSELLSVAAIREGVRAVACLPLKVDGQIVGGLDVCFKSRHAFGEDELEILSIMAQQAAVAIHKAQLVDRLDHSYLSTIQALTAAVEAKDPYTRGHSERVRRLAVATGQEMGLDEHQLRLLNLAALFHDIGKIGVPESLLHKPSSLTCAEMELIRQHPVWAEPILRHVSDMPDLVTIVRHHHERFDGKGYPDGVSSRLHPLSAIICVTDAYDTMTTDRPYRSALNHREALEELVSHTGTQFMPQAVEGFVKVMARRRVPLLDDHQIPSVVFSASLPPSVRTPGKILAPNVYSRKLFVPA